MTRDEIIVLIRRYGQECVAGGMGATYDDSEAILEEIEQAVHAHWDSEPVECEHCAARRTSTRPARDRNWKEKEMGKLAPYQCRHEKMERRKPTEDERYLRCVECTYTLAREGDDGFEILWAEAPWPWETT